VGIAKRIGGIELCDDGGVAQPLGALWRERPVVLVFLRHFG